MWLYGLLCVDGQERQLRLAGHCMGGQERHVRLAGYHMEQTNWYPLKETSYYGLEIPLGQTKLRMWRNDAGS